MAYLDNGTPLSNKRNEPLTQRAWMNLTTILSSKGEEKKSTYSIISCILNSRKFKILYCDIQQINDFQGMVGTGMCKGGMTEGEKVISEDSECVPYVDLVILSQMCMYIKIY